MESSGVAAAPSPHPPLHLRKGETTMAMNV